MPKLDRQPEPPTHGALKDEVARRWGVVDLLDILKFGAWQSNLLTEWHVRYAALA